MVMLRVSEHATPVGPTEDSLVSCLTGIARRGSRAGARNQLPSECACCRDCAAIEWAERSNCIGMNSAGPRKTKQAPAQPRRNRIGLPFIPWPTVDANFARAMVLFGFALGCEFLTRSR